MPNPAICSLFADESYEYYDCAQSMGEMYTMLGQQGLFLVSSVGDTMTLTLNRDAFPQEYQEEMKAVDVTLSLTNGRPTKIVIWNTDENE